MIMEYIIIHYKEGAIDFIQHKKSIALFEELIRKHSNESDVVMDTFLGGGTTAIACTNTKRKFTGCEISKEYFNKMMKQISI